MWYRSESNETRVIKASQKQIRNYRVRQGTRRVKAPCFDVTEGPLLHIFAYWKMVFYEIKLILRVY